jgi:hypothetical protein
MSKLCHCNGLCVGGDILRDGYSCRMDYQLAPYQADYDNRVIRKVFVCVGCEGLYGDEPVTQCDCMLEPPQFIETTVTYQKGAAPMSESKGGQDGV